MTDLFIYVIGALGLVSSIITIFDSFKKNSTVSKIASYVILLVIFVLIFSLKSKNTELKQALIDLNESNKSLCRDADVVSRSIVISGWESNGELLGNLSSIKSFYYRHLDKYQSEYEDCTEQLSIWRKSLNNDHGLSFDQRHDLQGYVKSADEMLEQICRNEK